MPAYISPKGYKNLHIVYYPPVYSPVSKLCAQVYIGNLAGGVVTEDALRQLFNSTMAAAFPTQMVAGLDAVVNVSMHSEGRYAFVELRSPEMATAALQLSGQVNPLIPACRV